MLHASMLLHQTNRTLCGDSGYKCQLTITLEKRGFENRIQPLFEMTKDVVQWA